MKLFLADSAKHLRQNLKKYGCEIGQYESYAFADGERGYRLRENVRGESVVLIADDMIDTGGTLSEALKLVSQNGAQNIRLAATHGIFSGEARDRLICLPIKEILVTNTLPQIRSPKIRILDISPLVLHALART